MPNKIKVAVNGYGVIGKRVADAVRAQEDMELLGVSDVTTDYRVATAITQGISVGAVAKLGGEQRRLSFSFPDRRCVWALLGRLEDPVDDHRVRVRLPIGKHCALPFPQ